MRLLTSLCVLVAFTACANNSKRVQPESLLNASSENVSFGLVDSSSVSQIINWVKDDKPTEAEVSCADSNHLCAQVKNKLRVNGVPFQMAKSPNGTDSVTLLYSRVSASDCKPADFGCSTSVNTVQMVTDRNTFIRPVLSAPQDSARAVKAYNKSMK